MTASAYLQERTRQLLAELNFPVHYLGYKVLCEAIPLYAEDDMQSLTKELYPTLAKIFQFSCAHAVERPIRYAISFAWEHRNSEIWEHYFPNLQKAPSNMVFIATLAEWIK